MNTSKNEKEPTTTTIIIILKRWNEILFVEKIKSPSPGKYSKAIVVHENRVISQNLTI